MLNYKEFLRELKQKHSFHYDDEDDKKITLYHEAVYNLILEIDKKSNKFDIYIEFTHPLYHTEEYEHEGKVGAYYSNSFKALLREMFLACPEESSFNYLGAPFDDQCIGYFNVEFDLEFIASFIRAGEKWIDCLNNVQSDQLTGHEILKDLASAKWNDLKEKIIPRGYTYENNTFRRHNGQMLIKLKNAENNFEIEIENDFNYYEKITDTHFGVNYLLFKSIENNIVAVRRSIYDELQTILQAIDEELELSFFINKNGYLCFETEFLYGKIKLADNINLIRSLEYNFLEDGRKTFEHFALPEMVKQISFEDLDDQIFENLAMDFLDCSGYYDIHPLGKTRASDGGRDFFAKKRSYSIDNGSEKEQWIVQCKHSKSDKRRTFSRAMFSEIPDLLGENKSDKYLLLTTADLTPQTIDRIRYINENKNNIIDFYAVNELRLALSKYPKLIQKYNLIKD